MREQERHRLRMTEHSYDMTEDLDSGVSAYAVADMERLTNMLNRYFKATFEINVIQNRLKNKNVDASVEACLHFLKYDLDRSGQLV